MRAGRIATSPRKVLARNPNRLGVLRVAGVYWNDSVSRSAYSRRWLEQKHNPRVKAKGGHPQSQGIGSSGGASHLTQHMTTDACSLFISSNRQGRW